MNILQQMVLFLNFIKSNNNLSCIFPFFTSQLDPNIKIFFPFLLPFFPFVSFAPNNSKSPIIILSLLVLLNILLSICFTLMPPKATIIFNTIQRNSSLTFSQRGQGSKRGIAILGQGARDRERGIRGGKGTRGGGRVLCNLGGMGFKEARGIWGPKGSEGSKGVETVEGVEGRVFWVGVLGLERLEGLDEGLILLG